MKSNLSQKAGKPAGTLEFIGNRKISSPVFSLVEKTKDGISRNNLFEKDFSDLFQNLENLKNSEKLLWINLTGLHDISLIESLGKIFKIHPLILEDILDTEHSPKLEKFENYLYLELKRLQFDSSDQLKSEQLSLLLGDNFLLTFLESEPDYFETVNSRINSDFKSDKIFYLILDFIVDNYFLILDTLSEKIEALDEILISNLRGNFSLKLKEIRQNIMYFRRAVRPLRDIMRQLCQDESEYISDKSRLYLRDVYDHVLRIQEEIETLNETVSVSFDIYLSSQSNRLNEIMKILTVISTIFIPLTFIAGVYGMNFHEMPELSWEWGYPLVWTIMIGSALSMLFYFRKKNWF